MININDQDEEALRTHNAQWISLEKKPDLIFDHDEMVNKSAGTFAVQGGLTSAGL